MLISARVSGGVLATAVAWAAACGSSPGASGSVADLASAICEVTFRCCSSGEAAYLLGPFVDRWSCADRLLRAAEVGDTTGFVVPAGNGLVTVPNVAVLERAVNEGRVEIDQKALEACVAYLRELPCNLYEVPPDGQTCVRPDPAEENPCETERIFRGRVEEGGVCSSPGSTLECAGGADCRGVAALGATGVCLALGKVGDYCFEDRECAEELYCSLLDGTCRSPADKGETCLYADRDNPATIAPTLLLECAEGLQCDAVTDTCVGQCDRGASCAFDSHCDETLGLHCVARRCDYLRSVGGSCLSTTDCERGLRCAANPLDPSDYACAQPKANGSICTTTLPDECESGFCNNWTGRCESASALGELCPSALHSQCSGGYCKTEYAPCKSDEECPESGHCNLAYEYCEYYCLALLSEGASCEYAFQCESDACVLGQCREIPLGFGEECFGDEQCGSGFCNFESTRYCDLLPLRDGKGCSLAEQCESGICFEGLCSAGLAEGADCSMSYSAPCARDRYCNWHDGVATCERVLEPGAVCGNPTQCRGECTMRFGRFMCDDTPAYERAVCDGR